MKIDLPYRCTECGAITEAQVKGLEPRNDAAFTPLDPRYRTAWCPWHRRPVAAVRAATIVDAVHHPDRPEVRADQLKGPW